MPHEFGCAVFAFMGSLNALYRTNMMCFSWIMSLQMFWVLNLI